jgi:pimeloyl-ACP methyl ester carboxylesterase/nucleotide-binding universal stress UspA family protein
MHVNPDQCDLYFASTRDGKRLGYTNSGDSGIAVIAPLSYRTTLTGLAKTFSQRAFLAAVGSGHQFVAYDQRGTGSSRAAGVPESWDQRGRDLWSVADAAGVERAVLYGTFDSGYTIAEAALQQPERVLGVIFNFVPPVFLARPDYPFGLPRETVEEAYGSAAQSARARQVLAMRSVGINDSDAQILVTEWEQAADAAVLDRLQELFRAADLRPLAPSIRVPALVIEPRRRPLIVGWGEALGRLLPRSTVLHSESAGAMLGAIQGFLTVIQIDEGLYASKVSSAFSSAARAAERSVTALRRILVPVLGSSSSERAVEMACRLGAAQQAEVVLVHVIAVPLTRSLTQASDAERERGERVLHLGQAIVDRHGMRSCARLLTERTAASGILRAAAEEQADVIVMAMDETRGGASPRESETMREVLRRAPCEVLIDQSHAFPMHAQGLPR